VNTNSSRFFRQGPGPGCLLAGSQLVPKNAQKFKKKNNHSLFFNVFVDLDPFPD
jgi:hypothetical protein